MPVHAAALHARLLVLPHRQHVLFDHHLEHPDRLLTGTEAVFEAEVVNDLIHGPRFALHKFRRVSDVRPCIALVVKAETVGDGFSTTFHRVAPLRHALLDACLQLQAVDKPTLEPLTGLFEPMRSLLKRLLGANSFLVVALAWRD